MFERVEARAEALAQERARARVAEMAGRAAPAGARVAIEGNGIVVSGRGLGRRMVTDAAVREWLR